MIKSKAANGEYGRCSGLTVSDFQIGDRVVYVYGSLDLIGCKGAVENKRLLSDGNSIIEVRLDYKVYAVGYYSYRLQKISRT